MMTLVMLLSVSGLTAFTATNANAHTQNMKVAVACKDGVYNVTYTLNYDKGVPKGSAFHRTGTTSFQNGWKPTTWNDWIKESKDITTTSGSVSWTTTLPGNTTVAPWEYSQIKWKDGYVTQGDTRPEGLKGDCKPDNNNWTYTVACDGVSGSRPNTGTVDSNIRIKNLETGETRTFNYHGSDNGPAGAFKYTLAMYGVPSSWKYIEILWTQVHGTNYHWEGSLKCGTPPTTDVTATAPTSIDKCGIADDKYTVPSKEGVEYLVNGVVTAAGTYSGTGTVEITTRALKGFSLTGTKSWTFKFTNELCPIPDKPSVPTAPSSVDVCEPLTGSTKDSVTVPNDPNFQYSLNDGLVATGTYPATQDRYIFKAVPKPGIVLKEGAQSVWDFTFSKVKCVEPPTPPVTPPTPPVVTPPTPPAAKPVDVRADLKKFRKCGADYFRVKKSAHVQYTANGKIIREGVKLKVTGKTVVRAKATGNSALRGKRTWTIRDVTPKYCDAPPRKTPNTGI